MLYIGEKLGNNKGQLIDIAVDLWKVQILLQKTCQGLFCFAISEKNLFKAPETYMNKIAYGQNIPKDVIDLDNSIEKI